MTVEELIKLLEKMPKKVLMVFQGYSMGGTFLQKVEPQDFILSEEKEEVVIKADWN